MSQPHVECLCRYHTYIIESLYKQGKWSKNWLRGLALSWPVPWTQLRRFGREGCSLNWYQTRTSSPMWQWEHRAAPSFWYTHSTRSPTTVCPHWPPLDILKWMHSGPKLYILMSFLKKLIYSTGKASFAIFMPMVIFWVLSLSASCAILNTVRSSV